MRLNSNKDREERGSVYPLIPLRDVVIFPSMATAILVVVLGGYFITTVLAARRIALEKPRGRHV
ncbi:MAG: hypothetical protein NTW58_05350 [Actinobacteria bacterium]|nr:hypothetical protein [Actinomycetota bacterium]